jgi:hypothetical protein
MVITQIITHGGLKWDATERQSFGKSGGWST